MKLNRLATKYLAQQVKGYVSVDQSEQELNRYLRLDLGENLLGHSPNIIKELQKVTDQTLHLYADPNGMSIKQVLAKLANLTPNNIVIANSSNEMIAYLPKMILETDDKVLITHPTFFRYIESTLAAGGKIIDINLPVQQKFIINDELLATIINKINEQKIELVWLANPNNPTGQTISLEVVKKILAQTQATVILDEAFIEYLPDYNSQSGVQLVNKYPNLIVLRTLSKCYGLAGLRFSYLLAHPQTVTKISRYQNTLLMTSSLIQRLAKVALLDQKWLTEVVKSTTELRQDLFTKISQLSNYVLATDSKTNIYLLAHKHKNLYSELKKQGILAADFSGVKGVIDLDYVRLTVGNKKQNQLLLKALTAIN